MRIRKVGRGDSIPESVQVQCDLETKNTTQLVPTSDSETLVCCIPLPNASKLDVRPAEILGGFQSDAAGQCEDVCKHISQDFRSKNGSSQAQHLALTG